MRMAALLLASVAAWGANCSQTSLGLPPFTEPFSRPYQGQPVSLYPTGNQRPAAHEALGLKQAAAVVPRDSMGSPNSNGQIVLLSIGFSNTTEEFSTLIP